MEGNSRFLRIGAKKSASGENPEAGIGAGREADETLLLVSEVSVILGTERGEAYASLHD